MIVHSSAFNYLGRSLHGVHRHFVAKRTSSSFCLTDPSSHVSLMILGMYSLSMIEQHLQSCLKGVRSTPWGASSLGGGVRE